MSVQQIFLDSRTAGYVMWQALSLEVRVEFRFCLSFRGVGGDEESRTALENIQSKIPRFARNDGT